MANSIVTFIKPIISSEAKSYEAVIGDATVTIATHVVVAGYTFPINNVGSIVESTIENVPSNILDLRA